MYNGNNFKQFTHMAILSYGQVGWRSAVAAPVSGIDADAQAFITAASITDTTQQSAINTLVTQLKTYGIWTKLKAVYPFVGGTASSHKFNLKDPRDLDAAFRLVFNGGWVHSSTGAKPNGTTAYADTKLVPNSVLSLNSTHISSYIRNTSTGVLIGTDNAYRLWIAPNFNGSTKYVEINTTTTTPLAISTAVGLWVGNRTANNVTKLFNNNTVNDVTSQFSTGLDSRSIFLASRNDTGTAINYSSAESAFASIGDGLTDTEAANFYTAVQTFQTTLGRQVGVPIVADTDAQAFITATAITDATQQTAINALVTDLKSANIWTKMKAIYPFVGGTATTHKYNLKDPRDLDAAYRLVFNGGWTHDGMGVLPNGTTAYADTKLQASSALTLNNTHLSFYSRTNSSANAADFGAAVNSPTLNVFTKWSDNNAYHDMYSSGGDRLIINMSAINTNSLFITSRTSSTSLKVYRAGSQIGVTTVNQNINSLPTSNLFMSAQNNNGTAQNYSNRQQAFASIGDGLTDAEAAAFYTAVQKYQTSLGRQV